SQDFTRWPICREFRIQRQPPYRHFQFRVLAGTVPLRNLRRSGQGKNPVKLVIGISGATGVVYGIRLLEVLQAQGVETHLVITDMAKATIAVETTHCMSKVERLASKVYQIR